MKTVDCMDDHDLMPLLDGETISTAALAHVNSCPDCQSRLGSLKKELKAVRATVGDRSGSEATIVTTADRPAMIGQYMIVGVLDDGGGQATVYRGVHPMLGRDVVIKLGRKPLEETSDAANLLVKEGQVLAQLEHPNIAPVYDLALHEGRPFLAMKYIRGQSLDQAGANKRLAPARAAEIVAKIARALAAAHELDVIHQDVKPRNIMVDDTGKPYLIDFGIARLRQAFAEADNDPTLIGGTASYISPEQARLEAGKIGPPSDIFCLGGTLFYLLTGENPFGKGPETLDRAARCEFKRELLNAPGVPAPLRRICLRALAPEPGDRFQSADAMAEALEKFPRRNAMMIRGWAAAAALAIAVGGVAWTYHAIHITPDDNGAHVAARPASDQPFVQVLRKSEPLNLKSALPLHRDDQMVLAYEIPNGWHYAMLSLTTDGKIQKLMPQVLDGKQGVTRLVYPGGKDAATLDEKGGTEFVFVCASPNAIDESALKAVLDSAGTLPKLPINTIVKLQDDKAELVSVHTDGFAGSVVNDGRVVQDLVEKMRGELHKQSVPMMSGVAFSH